MKAKAKSTPAEGFGSANSGVSQTSPKPDTLLVAEAKTLIVNASKDGKLRVGCNSSMTMLLLACTREMPPCRTTLQPDTVPG